MIDNTQPVTVLMACTPVHNLYVTTVPGEFQTILDLETFSNLASGLWLKSDML